MNVRKQLRVKEAAERAAERAKRTPAQQLARLDAKLGDGAGAKKERTRLLDQQFANVKARLVKSGDWPKEEP